MRGEHFGVCPCSALYQESAPCTETQPPLALVTLGLALEICPVILGAATSNRQTDVMPTSNGELRLMPMYHGSVMLELAGKVIHIDPWSQGDYTGLPPADLIVVTHTRRDHLDMTMIDKLKKPGTIIVGTPATVQTANCAPACGRIETVTDSEKKTVMGIEIDGVPMYNLVQGARPGRVYRRRRLPCGAVYCCTGLHRLSFARGSVVLVAMLDDLLDKRVEGFVGQLLTLEEHSVEDEELADPHQAEGSEIGQVDDQRMRVPLPRNEPDADGRERETQKSQAPERCDLAHEVVLPAFLPDPVPAEEIGGRGADANREDVRRHSRPPNGRLSGKQKALAQRNVEGAHGSVAEQLCAMW